ncbi:hypothetical protein AQUCO_03600054v1 [Aquilegia coerulea]|uniref:Retrotransposon gag domain-containing protein n=1 Tax=Aquilegia coerulea TaxID=218851 RepID=A0A2G5CV18_AQUCA|nr:hypothetical protein AQUCO_03600054v1 [Aquilegia coerulea]
MTQTRNQELEASVKALENRFDDLGGKHNSLQSDVLEMKDSMKEMNEKFDFLTKGIKSLLGDKELDAEKIEAVEVSTPMKVVSPTAQGSVSGNGILGPTPGIFNRPTEGNHGSTSKFHEFSPRSVTIPNRLPDLSRQSSGTNSSFGKFKIPKLAFPQFGGDDVRTWIRKADRYFSFNPIDPSQMALFASLHLEGKAEIWLQSCFDSLNDVSWEEFTEAIRSRFF